MHLYNNIFWSNGSPELNLLPGGSLAETMTASANRFDVIPSGAGIVLGAGNVVAAPGFMAPLADDHTTSLQGARCATPGSPRSHPRSPIQAP